MLILSIMLLANMIGVKENNRNEEYNLNEEFLVINLFSEQQMALLEPPEQSTGW